MVAISVAASFSLCSMGVYRPICSVISPQSKLQHGDRSPSWGVRRTRVIDYIGIPAMEITSLSAFKMYNDRRKNATP